MLQWGMLSNQTAQLNLGAMALSCLLPPAACLMTATTPFPDHFTYGRKSEKSSALNQLAYIRVVTLGEGERGGGRSEGGGATQEWPKTH